MYPLSRLLSFFKNLISSISCVSLYSICSWPLLQLRSVSALISRWHTQHAFGVTPAMLAGHRSVLHSGIRSSLEYLVCFRAFLRSLWSEVFIKIRLCYDNSAAWLPRSVIVGFCIGFWLFFFIIWLFSWFSSNVLETLTRFGGCEPGMCGNSVVWQGDQG